IGSDVVAVREHDHGIAAASRSGLGSVDLVRASRNELGRISNFGNEPANVRQFCRWRRRIAKHTTRAINEGAARHSHRKWRSWDLLRGEISAGVRERGHGEWNG